MRLHSRGNLFRSCLTKPFFNLPNHQFKPHLLRNGFHDLKNFNDLCTHDFIPKKGLFLRQCQNTRGGRRREMHFKVKTLTAHETPVIFLVFLISRRNIRGHYKIGIFLLF